MPSKTKKPLTRSNSTQRKDAKKHPRRIKSQHAIGSGILAALLLALGLPLLLHTTQPSEHAYASPPAAPANKAWQQTWSDEFSGSSVDTSKWNVQNNSNYGSGNHEDACYMTSNTSVSEGMLRLTGQRQTVNCGGTNPDTGNSTYYFTSGMVTTRAQGGAMKFKFKQGYAEARIKVPKGNPYWPAFWLVSPNDGSTPGWPDYGEFDVMEAYGSRPDVTTGTLHYKCTKSGGHCKTSPNIYNIKANSAYGGNSNLGTLVNDSSAMNAYSGGITDFNTYGFLWEANKITWYVNGRAVRFFDGNALYRIESNGSQTLENSISTLGTPTTPFSTVFGYDHSIILNMAIGGDGPRYSTFGYTGTETASGYSDGNYTATNPGSMEVDYVRVYQLTDAATPPPPPPPTPTVDSTPPTATLTAPVNGSIQSGNIAVSGTASDNVQVATVELRVDDAVVSTDNSAPYSFTLDTTKYANGEHRLLLRAKDTSGNLGQSSVVTINVNNTTSGGSTKPPKPDNGHGKPPTKETVISSTSPSSSDSPLGVVGTLIIEPTTPGSKLEVYVDNTIQPNNTVDTTRLTDGTHQVKIVEEGKSSVKHVQVDNPLPLAMVNHVRANPAPYSATAAGIVVVSIILGRQYVLSGLTSRREARIVAAQRSYKK